MAIDFKDLIAASREYADTERRSKVTETISSADLKMVMSQAMAMGGDINENVLKLYDEMRKQTSMVAAARKDDTAAAEDKQEASKNEEDQTKVLKQIAENTDPKNLKKEADSELGLGKIVAGITAAVAGLAGVIAGYVKSIKVFLDVLTPDFIKTKVAKTFANIENTFVEFGTKIKAMFGRGVDKISAFLTDGIAKLKTLFTFDDASKFSKFIDGFKTGFAKLSAPFVEAFNTIKNLMSGTSKGLEFVGGISQSIMKTVGSIGQWMGKIANLFKGVFGVVSKLATPLFVIMTLWDTVSNVIDRFQSDGVIGAIAGVFEGILKSVIAAPLDLLKDIVSWVLGAFGFDNAEKFLDSFSFVDIVKGFFDAILHPIDTIVNMFEGVADLVDEYIVKPLKDVFAPVVDFFVGIKDSIVGFFEGIEIPKIGFTIPIIDKEVSIGPFYPFKRETAEVAPVGRPGTPSANYASRTPEQWKNGESPSASTPTPTVNGAPAPTSRQEYYIQQGFTPDQIASLNSRQERIDAIKAPVNNVDLAIAAPEVLVQKEEASFVPTVPTTPTNAVAVPEVRSPQAANAVYGASAENAGAAVVAGGGTTNNVVAPTTVNNTTNQMGGYKPDVRNQDSSFKRMLDSRYVPV